MRVLLAVSSLGNRRAIVDALGQFVPADCITCVCTGSELMAHLRCPPAYDVALVEQKLPDFDADHVIRLARGYGPCPPILVVSAEPCRDQMNACLRAGARDFLSVDEARIPGRLPARMRLAIAEARREQRVSFEQRAQFLLSLAGNVAHDLNNGLMTVLGKASLLHQELDPESPQADFCDAVIHSAEQLSEAAQQLAAYAPPGARQDCIDINQCVQEAVNRLQAFLPRRSVQIQLQLGPRIWPCKAHAAQVTQAILALLVNACEAMPTGGALSIFTENSLGATEHGAAADDVGAGQYVHLRISDTGCGIPSQLRRRIFEPFVTTRGAGRGLGLTAVATTVTQLDGFLAVESEVDCGTDVHLYLPRAAYADRHEPQETEAEARRTVLVVEDDPNVREVEVEILESHGYSVLTACDGASAIDIYRRHSRVIDLVLLDIKLPGAPGDEVYRSLARINPDVRVIVCTGANNDAAAAAVLKNCSVSAYLPKPFSPKRLIQQAQAVLHA